MLIELPTGKWMARCPLAFCSWYYVKNVRAEARAEFERHWIEYHEGEHGDDDG